MEFYILTLKLHLAYVFRWNSWKEDLLLFTYLITLTKDVTFPLITKFKNKQVSELFICKSNTELKLHLAYLPNFFPFESEY